MNTSEIIKQLREKTAMNRTKFAEHLGIPLRTIEDWESGKENYYTK